VEGGHSTSGLASDCTPTANLYSFTKLPDYGTMKLTLASVLVVCIVVASSSASAQTTAPASGSSSDPASASSPAPASGSSPAPDFVAELQKIIQNGVKSLVNFVLHVGISILECLKNRLENLSGGNEENLKDRSLTSLRSSHQLQNKLSQLMDHMRTNDFKTGLERAASLHVNSMFQKFASH